MNNAPESSPQFQRPIEKPELYVDTRPDEELPHLSQVELDALRHMPADLLNPTTLEEFGLDFNNGLQAVIVEGQRRYINTNENDFGTQARQTEQTKHTSPEHLSPESEEIADADTLPTEVTEFVGAFATTYEGDIESLLLQTAHEDTILRDVQDALTALGRSDSLTDREYRNRIITQQTDNLQQLRSMLGSDQQLADTNIRHAARRFNDEIELLTDAIRRDEAATDDLRHKARIIANAAQELDGLARGTDMVSSDASEEMTAVFRTMDEMVHDSWGYETYLAQISQQLGRIEQNLLNRRAYLQRAQEELPALKKLTT